MNHDRTGEGCAATPTTWAEVHFSDLFKNVTSSGLKLQKRFYLKKGRYPVIDQGEDEVGGFSDSGELVHPGPLPAVIFGDHTRCVKFTTRKFIQGADGIKVLAPATGVDPRFAFWALKSAEIPDRGYARHFSLLKNLSFPLPPIGEQTRIVFAIDSYFSRLDAAIESLKRVQANLKRYRASVLKAAVEGRLVPTEAELAEEEGRDYEPASVLLERILKERRRKWEEAELAKMKTKGKEPKTDKWKETYKESVVPDTRGSPDLPEGWCWASIDQLAASDPNSLTDGPFGSNLKTSHYTESGPRVVRLQNIGEGRFIDEQVHISRDHFSKLRKHQVLAGDLVIRSLGAELPVACKIPDWLGLAIVKADCIRFLPDNRIASADYLVQALNATPTRQSVSELVHGMGRPRIGLTLLRRVALPVAPLQEQTRIVETVQDKMSVIDHSNAELESVLDRCQRLRQSILKWAFEGKLGDQDPTDEPATVLLERIRADREAQAPPKKKRSTKKAATGQQTLLD